MNVIKKDYRLRIVSIVLIALGLITTLVTLIINFIFKGSPPMGLIIAYLFAISIVFVIGIYQIYFLTQDYKRDKVKFHYDFNTIKKRIKELCKNDDYEYVYFIGELDEEIVRNIISNFDSANIKAASVISTCCHSYKTSFSDELIQHEINNADEKFMHRYLNRKQQVNIFIAKTNKEKKDNICLFYWKINETRINGIEFGNSKLEFNEILIFQEACSISIEDQIPVIKKTQDRIKNLWLPFYNGYYKNILPPIENNEVRKIWRDEILKWYNNYGLSILNSVQNQIKLDITWRITINSIDDYNYFKNWLSKLKELTIDKKIFIRRYFLIDMPEYHSKTDYKNVVDEIIKYIENDKNLNYKFYFLDNSILDSEINNDYSIFYISDKKLVQSSMVDSNGSCIPVLKIFFTKKNDIVNRTEMCFEDLNKKKLYENFSELIAQTQTL